MRTAGVRKPRVAVVPDLAKSERGRARSAFGVWRSAFGGLMVTDLVCAPEELDLYRHGNPEAVGSVWSGISGRASMR
jgi:hypothetical protein